MKDTDVLIIGAGPGGSVAAAYLQANNVRVRVVEKSRFPRFTIGESLLPRSMEHFEATGLLPCIEARGFEVKTGARFLRDGVECLFDFSQKHSKGWDWTWQVPRAEFDKVLIDEVASRGVPVDFGVEVTEVDLNADGSSNVTLKDESGAISVIKARHIIDCSGNARVIGRKLGLDAPAGIAQHTAIFGHVQDVRRPDDANKSLISFDVFDDDTWMWSIPFSNGISSVGFVGLAERIAAVEGSPEERMAELLKLTEMFHDRYAGLEFIVGPYEAKNYSHGVTKLYGKGYVLAGNSASFLDPIFSSGVAFATESSLLAARLIHREIQGEKVDWEVEYNDHIKGGVEVFRTYVAEWYTGNLQKLFFHRPENLEVKKQICAVLAGYVWDRSNPFVTKHDRIVKNLAHLIDMEKEASTASGSSV
ncbi:MAG: NAD(P)/FAD-dependent oxidoreductase [Flavobacteriales bacterium]